MNLSQLSSFSKFLNEGYKKSEIIKFADDLIDGFDDKKKTISVSDRIGKYKVEVTFTKGGNKIAGNFPEWEYSFEILKGAQQQNRTTESSSDKLKQSQVHKQIKLIANSLSIEAEQLLATSSKKGLGKKTIWKKIHHSIKEPEPKAPDK